MKVRKALVVFAGSLSFVFNTLFANTPEIIEDENGEPIGIKLNLPKELINICKNEYWQLTEKTKMQYINECMLTPQGCTKWCNENNLGTQYNHLKRCEFAYALLLANEKGYVINKDFCKKTALDKIFACLSMCGAVHCLCLNHTVEEQYISCLENIIEYCF